MKKPQVARSPFIPWNSPPLRVDDSVDEAQIKGFHSTALRGSYSTKNLSERALELVKIRKKLGMTQADFAMSIGLEKDKIVNIENGRVRNIPDEILDEARKVMEGAYYGRVKPLADLQNLSMPEILDRWWAMMGVDNDEEGAILLGVCGLTVERWRTQPSRPAARDILRYDLIARKIAEKLTSSPP
ncbi:hypothetical protein [Allochromatium tepidum]|nr:hypothetical protein [Allochromatium tepidum]